MKTYPAGTEVQNGIYWSYTNGRCVTAGKDVVTLPGSGSYIKVPAIFFVVAGPILGLSFVLFLPFIGFAFIGYQASKLIGQKIASSTAAVSGMVPGYAYFAKKDKPRAFVEKIALRGPTPLDEIEKEVQKRMKK